MKNLIRKILIESTEEKFINTVVSKLKPPYFKNLKKFPIEPGETEMILSLIFGEDITIKDDNQYYNTVINSVGNQIYREDSDGWWEKYEYDNIGEMTYRETSGGDWMKWEYDEMGNLIYREDDTGWEKWGYDDRGNRIYYEDSDKGVIVDKR